MPRARGNDLAEIFGYEPDDKSDLARRQWKSQKCPFVGNTCIKHSHPRSGESPTIFGTCSVVNSKGGKNPEEVILCPQRLYADNYQTLRACGADACTGDPILVMASDGARVAELAESGAHYGVMFGSRSGSEVQLKGTVSVSLDWVIAILDGFALRTIVPVEVQSIDITGNYHACWEAYSVERMRVPNSKHGMNWANVWKRLIPQILLKGAIAGTSRLCRAGSYFVLPDRVYKQFEKLVGEVPAQDKPGVGVLTVMTYDLGPPVGHGKMRQLIRSRVVRMKLKDFAESFASGRELQPLGLRLDQRVFEKLRELVPRVTLEGC